jgi:hypothetical protein
MWFRIPVRETESSSSTIPWFGFVEYKIGTTIPQGSPLGFRGHAIITEKSIHMPDRVLKDGTRIERLVAIIIYPL